MYPHVPCGHAMATCQASPDGSCVHAAMAVQSSLMTRGSANRAKSASTWTHLPEPTSLVQSHMCRSEDCHLASMRRVIKFLTLAAVSMHVPRRCLYALKQALRTYFTNHQACKEAAHTAHRHSPKSHSVHTASAILYTHAGLLL